MNARIAGHAGTPQLRQFHMVNTKTKFPRGISDQAISYEHSTESEGVRPGPGQQLGEVQPCDREATPSSKPQASSTKLQASSQTKTSLSSETLKQQATSVKS